MYKKFLAIDQYGNKVFIDKHPCKELMDLHCVKHADKLYRDYYPNGIRKTAHVGYVIAGHWYEVLRLLPLED